MSTLIGFSGFVVWASHESFQHRAVSDSQSGSFYKLSIVRRLFSLPKRTNSIR